MAWCSSAANDSVIIEVFAGEIWTLKNLSTSRDDKVISIDSTVYYGAQVCSITYKKKTECLQNNNNDVKCWIVWFGYLKEFKNKMIGQSWFIFQMCEFLRRATFFYANTCILPAWILFGLRCLVCKFNMCIVNIVFHMLLFHLFTVCRKNNHQHKFQNIVSFNVLHM